MTPSPVDANVTGRVASAARPVPRPQPAASDHNVRGASFAEALGRRRLEEDRSTDPAGLTFSRHALARMERRAIQMSPGELELLERAVSQAEEKGSRESLILMNDLALIVNVRDRIVVTAMGAARSKEAIYTNIDTVVMTRVHEATSAAHSRPALSEEA